MPVAIALAALIPIIAGGFYLSIGYVLGFSSVVAASVGAGAFGNGFTSITVALLAGLGVGRVNGFSSPVWASTRSSPPSESASR